MNRMETKIVRGAGEFEWPLSYDQHEMLVARARIERGRHVRKWLKAIFSARPERESEDGNGHLVGSKA